MVLFICEVAGRRGDGPWAGSELVADSESDAAKLAIDLGVDFVRVTRLELNPAPHPYILTSNTRCGGHCARCGKAYRWFKMCGWPSCHCGLNQVK